MDLSTVKVDLPGFNVTFVIFGAIMDGNIFPQNSQTNSILLNLSISLL